MGYSVSANPSDLAVVAIVSESFDLLTTDNLSVESQQRRKEMTREELARLLEQFAIVAIQTVIAPMEVDDQHAIICSSIDTIVETVMFCNDRNRFSTPSIN